MYDMLELFESGRCHMALLMRNLPVNSTVSREDSRRRMIPTKVIAQLISLKRGI